MDLLTEWFKRMDDQAGCRAKGDVVMFEVMGIILIRCMPIGNCTSATAHL
jgi:hypothetical protein